MTSNLFYLTLKFKAQRTIEIHKNNQCAVLLIQGGAFGFVNYSSLSSVHWRQTLGLWSNIILKHTRLQ